MCVAVAVLVIEKKTHGRTTQTLYEETIIYCYLVGVSVGVFTAHVVDR
jgi:hypothetical protein